MKKNLLKNPLVKKDAKMSRKKKSKNSIIHLLIKIHTYLKKESPSEKIY